MASYARPILRSEALSPPPLLLSLPLFSSLAQPARARLPASSNAAAFVICARRKTISSLMGRTGVDTVRPDGVPVLVPPRRPPRGGTARTRSRHANRAGAQLRRREQD